MNLKKKSRILAVITEILTFAAITSLVIFLLMLIGYLYKLFDINLVFLPILVCLSILAAPLLSDWIFTEEFFYKHCLKATSEETLLKKGFEYVVTSLHLDLNIESIEIDGKMVSYSEDKEKLKKMLEQNDKVTVFCHLIDQGRWVFWSISNKEKRGSREQLVSFELPSKKLLKKIQKKEKPCIDRKINALCIRNMPYTQILFLSRKILFRILIAAN